MSVTVRIPSSFRLSAIDKFVREIVLPNGQPASDHILLDFKFLNFIDGSGYTVLSNTIGWLIDNDIKVSFTNHQNTLNVAIRYLDDCGFFRRYLGENLSTASGIRTSTLPCTLVEHARSFSWIESSLTPWMCYQLEVSPGAIASVKTCVKELFNNINDHSARHTGYVHAQYYPNLRNLRITVSDFGVGVPTTIRGKFGQMSDPEAIRMAAEEGVTAQSQPNNMGAGLNFLIDCVTSNGGSVLIHSLTGSLSCTMEKGRQIRRPSQGRGSYPGTLVDITIDTRLFQGDDDYRGEVEW